MPVLKARVRNRIRGRIAGACARLPLVKTSLVKGPPKNLGLLLVASALAAGVLLTLAATPLYSGQVLVRDDLACFHLPLRYFYAQCIDRGLDFDYLPHLFDGFYLHGEGQVGMYHPAHILLYATLPFDTAFGLELLLSYPVMLLGIVLLLRRWRLPWGASVFAGILFAFGGYADSCYHYMHLIEILAHFPWTLLCIDYAFRSGRPIVRALGVLGVLLLTTSQLYLGYPPLLLVLGLLEGAYALALAWRSGRIRPLTLLLAAKVLAVGIAAMQVLPILDAAAHSVRASSEFDYNVSYHPVNALQLIAPYLFNRRVWGGPESGVLYAGAAATLCALWALLNLRQMPPRVRWLAIGCAVLAPLALLLAAGRLTPLYPLLFDYPIARILVAAARFVLVFHVAFIALAALGAALLWQQVAAATRPRCAWLLWLVPLASAGIAGAVTALRTLPGDPAWFAEIDPGLAGTTSIWLGTGIVTAATLFFHLGARGFRWALVALVLFTAADLWAYGLRIRPMMPLDELRAEIEIPADSQPGDRIEPDFRPVYFYNGCILHNRRMGYGYVAMPPQRALDHYANETAMRLSGIGWVRTRYGTNTRLNEAADAGIKWLPVPDPMPRVRLVTNAVTTSDPARDLQDIDIATTALVDRDLLLEPGPPGTATLKHEMPGHLRIHTNSATRQLLIISESYHRDWHARIDGHPAEPIPVYGDYLGVVIDAGHHNVALDFDAKSKRIGLIITAASTLLTLLFAAAILRTA